MVAKKRTQLRAKAMRQRRNSSEAMETEELPPDPKAFLHQLRESKREKQLNRSQSFLNRLRDQAGNGGISKSALRRRKKRMKEELKPRMEDLLTSLKEEGVLEEDESGELAAVTGVTAITASNGYSGLHDTAEACGTVRIRKNEPSIRTQRGAKLLTTKEQERFTKVISNERFRSSPFETLREIIKSRK
ncbi:AEL319Cp [Eremothecium gossypii ATCC 10895]|uniref:Ribosome biogenesis protein SLX9 n=1 Tax=Eremothecium gossypii (strain ATCC 10895 / CBS 109.51 / FGSC 9923 / NRRL Y-1056) TaxID=284811 RepID=SLX9_EREGS|nr:AEL319Cp [Eremothecium gossypii ATCC 10895]Q758S2.1 RecName: Full=Ribosome biogenesis protein SLX9 [Eremothecium gossypii ATCC 10895]AAS52365.1 AEL319Cp [Eremothecium gossypii ATCC 10895]AEY96662.1 FAEL319Cp [Eremothecium gossypii FDAG1]